MDVSPPSPHTFRIDKEEEKTPDTSAEKVDEQPASPQEKTVEDNK